MLAEFAVALAINASSPSQDIGLDPAELCQFVAENISDHNPGAPTPFVYRTRLFRAAGVDPTRDDAATIRTKMQTYWNRHREALVCSVPNSVVREGSILKLAMDSSNSEFVDDAVRRWQLDLNQIDYDTIYNDIGPEGETLLDWVNSQLVIHAGGNREVILRRYRNIIIPRGALRARDLPARR